MIVTPLINAGAANWNAAEASRVESLWANGFTGARKAATRVYEVTMPVR